MSFGNKVKQLRRQKKISQEELGKLIGCHPKHISKMENHNLVPYADTIKKIAEIFNVSTDYLLFDDVPHNTDLVRFNDSELVDLVFKIDTLSDKDRETAKNVLNALITKAKAESLFK
jgi:transcriptional regulator with XRE-family HTH domain